MTFDEWFENNVKRLEKDVKDMPENFYHPCLESWNAALKENSNTIIELGEKEYLPLHIEIKIVEKLQKIKA